MAQKEQDRAKELLLKGIKRKEVKAILRKEFRRNFNILSIAITRAAQEIEQKGKKNGKKK